ncbi:MAG: SH3 domain-containing protein [Syntrophaceae bacterium]|nr:SH3 domain-containing protein [Syntrophaceae bacterium]
MKKSTIFSLALVTLMIFFVSDFASAQVIKPKARTTPSGGPTIDQAQQEDEMGPKARVAVTRFEDKSAKGSSEIGNGMAEMLSNALFATNRFIVLERQALDDVLQEQDLGASGRVKQQTAARIGEVEGADLLIMGTITEFEPGTAGAGGGAGGIIPLPGRSGHIARGIGGIAGGVKTSHVAIIIKVVDARTGRRLASEQVEGKATDIGGMAGMGGWALAGAFGGYSKTPMEKAIRICINEAVRVIETKTPKEYYRISAGAPTPEAPPVTPQRQQAVSAPSQIQQRSAPPPGPEARVVYVKWKTVSLREGPGTNFKSIAEIKKGTALEILEEKEQWIRVRLEDGQEGWIGKATTSENP